MYNIQISFKWLIKNCSFINKFDSLKIINIDLIEKLGNKKIKVTK